MKIATFSANISPEVGALLAGYSAHDVSVAKHDDLFCSGILLDDGENRALLISFDLIGLCRDLVLRIRREVAAVAGLNSDEVILTCTHTHEGPHSRDTWTMPVDAPYCEKLVFTTVEAVKAMLAKDDFKEVDPYFYSAKVPVNVNRRYCGPENVCRYLPHHRQLEALGDGVVDPELGMLFFYASGTEIPVAAIANYAAHPLLNHAPGLGGLAISADYPGDFRNKIANDTGAFCLFTTGAAGNQFPKGSELGYSQLDEFTRPLAAEFIRGMANAHRNPDLFKLSEKVRCSSKTITVALRSDRSDEAKYPRIRNRSDYQIELQFLSIGDICFVGVPGELEAEPGLEIKWNSPFRKTWILYNSTDYIGYICPANDFVSGGYESSYGQTLEYRASFKIVTAVLDELFSLHGDPTPPPFQNIRQ